MSGGRPCINDIKGSESLLRQSGILAIECIVTGNKYLFYSNTNMLTRARSCISSIQTSRANGNLYDEWMLHGKENFKCYVVEATNDSSRLEVLAEQYCASKNGKGPWNKGLKGLTGLTPWNKLDRSMFINIENILKEIGVYYLKHTLTGKLYIGYGNLFDRINDHTKMLIGGKHWIESLQKDYNLDNLSFEVGVLEITDNTDREEYWIRYYKSHLKEFGYNTKYGRAIDETTRKKISVANKLNPSNGMLGKHHSLETRLKGNCYSVSLDDIHKMRTLHNLGYDYKSIGNIFKIPKEKVGNLLRDNFYRNEVKEC